MAKFKDFIPPRASVTRDGKDRPIDAINLVPGDIIKVREGDKIPADIRIVKAENMKVDNSSLTVFIFNNFIG
jgi:P-type E1-E2 ATPase